MENFNSCFTSHKTVKYLYWLSQFRYSEISHSNWTLFIQSLEYREVTVQHKHLFYDIMEILNSIPISDLPTYQNHKEGH